MTFDGSELKERRDELGYSLEEASKESAVAAHLIEALEEGDIAELPGESYATGFLRSYCRHLGLPPDGHVMGLKEAYRAKPDSTRGTRKLQLPRLPSIQIPRMPFDISPELQAWIAVCGVLLLSWFAYSTVVQPEQDTSSSQAQAASIDLRESASYKAR